MIENLADPCFILQWCLSTRAETSGDKSQAQGWDLSSLSSSQLGKSGQMRICSLSHLLLLSVV
jgi:hypothetical protein